MAKKKVPGKQNIEKEKREKSITGKQKPRKQKPEKPKPGKQKSEKKKIEKVPGQSHHLRTELIIAFFAPICLFVLTILLIYSVSSTTLADAYEDSANSNVVTLGKYFDLVFANVELMSTRLSVNETVTDYYSGGTKQTESMLMNAKMAINSELVADEYISQIVVIAQTGKACTDKGPINEDVYGAFCESEEGKYVQENIVDDIWIESHPSIDEFTGKGTDVYGMSYVKILRSTNNKPVGYIIIDVKREFLQGILDDAKTSDRSAQALVMGDGAQIVSGNSEVEFYETESYKKALSLEEEQGREYAVYDGEEMLFAYHKLENNMMVWAALPKEEIMAGAQRILEYAVISIVLCAFAAILLGIILSGSISKALKNANRALKKTADGDLTGQVTTNRKDEFLALTANIAEMIKSMKGLIRKMTNVSSYVSSSAEAVRGNSQLLLEVANQMNSAVLDINGGIAQQTQDTEQCASQMEDLSNKIEDVHKRATQVNELTKETRDAVNEGMIIVKDLEEKVDNSTEITRAIIAEIDELSKESSAISSIIETINEIAEETNLLSLNASIEAARVGEAGRGFAVVSSEIRKLADQSGNAGMQIAEIINHIQERMSTTIKTAQKAGDIVVTQSEALESTIDVFHSINKQIQKLGENITHIVQSVNGIEDAKEDTMSAIESISATSNETESASSELGNSSQKLMNAAQELSEAVLRLQEGAEDLDNSVKIFKTE
ncbi:MAG: methyl-accepting chemotaxis protein [Lachnospiraceae bacterium]|nr:methyl-accepting chemotaxis protein [Lachnospiraceae bacterium]